MRRLARRAYRLANTARDFLAGLPQHLRHRAPQFPSTTARVWEQARLLVTSGVSAKDYYVHGLFRQDITFREKTAYVGNFETWRWISKVSSFDHMILTEDKVIFENYLRAFDIPTMRTIVVIGPCDIPRARPPVLSVATFEKWMKKGARENLFLKPNPGIGGRGVLSLGTKHEGKSSWEQLPIGGPIELADIVARVGTVNERQRFVVQERLIPEPSLQRFCGAVLHTARMMTVMHRGAAQVVCAALKIGVGRHAADNLLRGNNIVASIDLRTGELGPGVMIENGRPTRVEKHPNSAVPIAGFVMPDWSAALDIVRKAATVFAMNRISSWDIAFTDHGPKVVEANIVFDPILVQLSHDRGLLSFDLMRSFILENHLGRELGFGLNPYVRRVKAPTPPT